jgi:hypothetical protein
MLGGLLFVQIGNGGKKKWKLKKKTNKISQNDIVWLVI